MGLELQRIEFLVPKPLLLGKAETADGGGEGPGEGCDRQMVLSAGKVGFCSETLFFLSRNLCVSPLPSDSPPTLSLSEQVLEQSL